MKQQRLSKATPKKSTKEAAVQCARQEDCKRTSDVAVQTDFPADVMEDLREQVKKLTQVVQDLTALKALDERKDPSPPLFSEDTFSDSLSDVLPFESMDVVVSETPTPPRTVNPPCIVQDPVLQTVPVSTSQNRPFPPGLPLNSQNNGAQSFPMQSPLSFVDQNLPATHHFGPTDEQHRKVEAMVFMGTQVVTTAMACVGVLFTDDELTNGNTSGSNGYRKLDDLKLRFLATALRQKFDSPVFSEQWETVRARINTKCRGKRRTFVRRLQKQTNV